MQASPSLRGALFNNEAAEAALFRQIIKNFHEITNLFVLFSLLLSLVLGKEMTA